MIHSSPLPDVEIPPVALPEYVLARAAELGDKPALIDGTTDRRLSYAQLADDVRRVAAGLDDVGFGRGDVLALVSPNLPEYAVVFHAVATLGGIITTINPGYTDREMHLQLADSGASVLVVATPVLPVASAAAAGTAVRRVYRLGDPAPTVASDLEVLPFADLYADRRADQVTVDPDDVVALPYSSGTTGGAKGVMLTHRNLVANVAQMLAASDVREDETMVAVLPFFHIYGMQVLMNASLRAGATVVTLPRFDLAQYLEIHQRYGVTRSFVAPPIVLAMAKHPMVDSYDLSALERMISGAAPLSAELGLEAGKRLGCEVMQGYGMTELSPVSHTTVRGDVVPGSVGVTLPNTQTRIVDPGSGEDAPDGQDGEIWVRGPQVMKGYLNNPAATTLTLDEDGWLHTGDIGHIESNGHVFVVDRLKELIKVSGFQVAPAELEALLLTHPAVADAAVLGMPDPRAGEVPHAFVVLKPEKNVGAEDLQEFVAGQVASYKQIRRVTFLETIPKSAAGKILRRTLRSTSTSPSA
jgi:4-coumarate--CoA ligase